MASAKQIAQALLRIPAQEAHGPECAALVNPHAGAGDDFVMRLASRGACDCDRDVRVAARQAEAVLDGLRAAVEFKHYRGSLDRTATEDFLRVLQQRAEKAMNADEVRNALEEDSKQPAETCLYHCDTLICRNGVCHKCKPYCNHSR